jgi:hypothetical protein
MEFDREIALRQLQRMPMRRAALLMMANALAHFLILNISGGYIYDVAALQRRQGFGIRAFSRTRAAQNKMCCHGLVVSFNFKRDIIP